MDQNTNQGQTNTNVNVGNDINNVTNVNPVNNGNVVPTVNPVPTVSTTGGIPNTVPTGVTMPNNISSVENNVVEQNVTQLTNQSPPQIINNNIDNNTGVIPNTTQNIPVTGVVPNSMEADNNQNINTGMNPDNGALTEKERRLKEIEINYKPLSKARSVGLVIFLLSLILFTIFLPEISSFMKQLRIKNNTVPPTEITTGSLVCEMKTSTENLDLNYITTFSFKDKQVVSLNYKKETRGDRNLDEKTLDEANKKCMALSNVTDSINGIRVSCDYMDGKLVETQVITYDELNMEEVGAAYAEAGGTYPDFNNGEGIEYIEKNMKAAGYTCEKKATK